MFHIWNYLSNMELRLDTENFSAYKDGNKLHAQKRSDAAGVAVTPRAIDPARDLGREKPMKDEFPLATASIPGLRTAGPVLLGNM